MILLSNSFRLVYLLGINLAKFEFKSECISDQLL